MPQSGNIAYLTGTVGLRRTDYALSLQDTWKLTPALTLNLGLRYDFFSSYPSIEVAGRMSLFRPDLNGVFTVGSSEIPYRAGVRPDLNNWGPRAGLAYRLGSATVVRAGYGLMYSPDPVMTVGDGNPPFAGSVAFSNNQFDFTGGRRLSQGFDRPAGVVFSAVGATPLGIDPNLRSPYASQWNLNIQRFIPRGVLLTAGYVGTSGKKLQLQPNLNQARPGPGAVAPRRPFPLYENITWVEGASSSIYHSLQVSTERRMAQGVGFLASYTWSHAIDYGSFVGSRQNTLDLRAERGNSDIDVRQRLIVSGMWEVPVGRGRMVGRSMSRVTDLLVGGWQINAIVSL